MANKIYEELNFKPIFKHRLFWDTDPDKINFTDQYEWVIRRVFERGNMDDIIALEVYYGDETVAEVLMNTPGLKKGDMSLAVMMFNLKPQDFLCYRQNRYHPNS